MDENSSIIQEMIEDIVDRELRPILARIEKVKTWGTITKNKSMMNRHVPYYPPNTINIYVTALYGKATVISLSYVIHVGSKKDGKVPNYRF